MTEAHASGEISRARENAGPNKTPTHRGWIADNRQITGNGRKRRRKEYELQTRQSRQPPRAATRILELTMPLRGAEALRMACGAGALEGLKVARPWFDNRHKNCCANIVMSIALPNRTSELIAGTFGIPE